MWAQPFCFFFAFATIRCAQDSVSSYAPPETLISKAWLYGYTAWTWNKNGNDPNDDDTEFCWFLMMMMIVYNEDGDWWWWFFVMMMIVWRRCLPGPRDCQRNRNACATKRCKRHNVFLKRNEKKAFWQSWRKHLETRHTCGRNILASKPCK